MKKRLTAVLLLTEIILGMMGGSMASAIADDGVDTFEAKTTVIVTLTSSPLVDYALAFKSDNITLRDFFMSDACSSYAEIIQNGQDAVIERIKETVKDADFSQSIRYNAVKNGFTVTLPADQIKTVQKIDGVLSAEPVREFENIKTQTDKLEAINSREYGMAAKSKINVQAAYDKGYTGKNQLIAIIDNEFEVTHDVFSVMPSEGKWDLKTLKKMNSVVSFNAADEYTINEIYKNKKIVFAFDYGDIDQETSSGDENHFHGTHVAGIAAGNNGGKDGFEFKGTAYDAQLALMKVADDDDTFIDSAIYAALDDAVKLGPDVINCSFGANIYGYDDPEDELYDKLGELGINTAVAAGNSSHIYTDDGFQFIPTDVIQYNTVASPSSYRSQLSVASIYPDTYYTQLSMKLNEEQIIAYENFWDIWSYDDPKVFIDYFAKDTEYVYLNATGKKSDYDNWSVKGKIVFVDRGGIEFSEKVSIAKKHGAAGVVIVDDRPKEGGWSLILGTNDLPCALVGQDTALYLKEHPKGTLQCSDEFTECMSGMKGKVSEFSSYGPASDLRLKPEIAAPGSDIISSCPGNSYGIISGTSMASPCTAGAMAVLRQYAEETEICKEMTPRQREEYIYSLMMSTADPMMYLDEGKENLYYSPRLQGAGVINLGKAITTETYLTVNGNRPKGEMLDNKNGEFSFHFEIRNNSNKEQTYHFDSVLETDGYEDVETRYLNTFSPVNIKEYAEVIFGVDGEEADTVSVMPRSVKTVDVSIRLDPDFVKKYNIPFSNGFYVDGFVMLNSDSGVSLNLPFLGFCGDWSKAPIFDKITLTGEESILRTNNNFCVIAGSGDTEEERYHYTSGVVFYTAGMNYYNNAGYMPVEYAFGRDSIKNSGLSKSKLINNAFMLPEFALLREVKDYTVSVSDLSGKIIFEYNFGSVSNNEKVFCALLAASALEEFDHAMDGVPDGEYIYTVSGKKIGTDGMPGKEEKCSVSIKFDNNKPTMENFVLSKDEEGKLLLTATYKDENYIQAIDVEMKDKTTKKYVSLGQMIFHGMAFEDMMKELSHKLEDDNTKYTVVYDITGLMDGLDEINGTENYETDGTYNFSKKDLILTAYDYALNGSDPIKLDLNSYGKAVLTVVDTDGKPVEGAVISYGDTEYISDKEGKITIVNLPVSKVELKVQSMPKKYTITKENVTLFLNSKHYNMEQTLKLAKPCASEPSTKPEQSSKSEQSSKFEQSSKISGSSEFSETSRFDNKNINSNTVNYETSTAERVVVFEPTGDDRSVRVTVFLLAVAGLLVLALTKKHKTV